MISVQEQRMKFSEAYNSLIKNAPEDLRTRADHNLYWENGFTYPHIDKNFVRQLPEAIINQLVELYETLRKGDL